MMDLPGNPRDLLVEDLRNLRIINRYLGGYRGVMKGLKRLVRKDRMSRFSLLDVGTGSADIPRVIAQWARNQGIKATVVALEPEPVTARVAAILTQQQTNSPVISRSCEKMRDSPLISPPSQGREERGQAITPICSPILKRENEGDFRRCGISVVRGDGNAPPFRPASFDFILASQLLHHFPEEKIVGLLRTWSQLARRAIIVSDLVRHPIAYRGIRLLTKLFTHNIMTLTDAPLSVQRAFTMAEWRELFRRAEIGPFQILSIFPYRVLAIVSPKK
jgi:SAM-dependent methyltransferase